MSILNKILLFLLSTNFCYSQQHEIDGYFLFPLNPGEQSSLAGTFGELRGNHFHSGIDIRTNGEENKPVKAAAEGYISRINVSENGFGKAIYIQHPNGYTTVYAHLNRFAENIEKYVRKAQYHKKTFTLTLYPKAGELPVNIGDLIALSGNTGGSQAPHLHFEIRNNKSEPINPLFAHFKELRDTIPPAITALTFSPKGTESTVNNSKTTAFLHLSGQLHQNTDKSIPATGIVGVGIAVEDQNNGASNMNGVNKILLYADNKLTYSYEIDKFSFAQSKYIKTHLEYDCYKLENIAAHRCYIDKTNPLPFYNSSLIGLISIEKGKQKNIRIEAYDFYNNKSEVNFTLTGSLLKNKTIKSLPSPDENTFFIDNGSAQTFKSDSCHIYFSTNSLFESMNLELNHIADTFDLQMNTAPLKGNITIGLRPNIPHYLREKTKVYSYNKGDSSFFNEGGNWQDDFIQFNTKSFDQYLCLVDTIKPIFSNPTSTINTITNEVEFKVTIQDNLSGVSKYQAKLNDAWVLLEYYPNSDSFQVLTLNNTPLKGKLVIEAWDDVDNKNIFKYSLK